MALILDHVVIAVHELEAAAHDYRELGFTVLSGGTHANHATRNALIVFADGTYLELLARTDEPPLPGLIDFSPMLQRGEGLAGVALRTDDLDAEIARLRRGGFTVSDALPGERQRPQGTIIRWRLALIDGGFEPFLIEDVTPRVWRIPDDPALTTHANRALGLYTAEWIVTKEICSEARDRWVRLLQLPDALAGFQNEDDEPIQLRMHYGSVFKELREKLPQLPPVFPHHIAQDEIDAAEPGVEPDSFSGIVQAAQHWETQQE